jgi:hypothetical protein
MDPLGQYKKIKILSIPELLLTKKQRKACQSALTYLSNLVQPNEYGIEQAKTVYFLRKEGELPIVIDSRASYSVTPNLKDFIGPIRKMLDKRASRTRHPNQCCGRRHSRLRKDMFGTVRSIKTTMYYLPSIWSASEGLNLLSACSLLFGDYQKSNNAQQY